jgi:hypothetical protein
MRPTANFKISKQTKRFMALGRFKNDQERHAYKNAMIQAELSAQSMERHVVGGKASNNE